eukprot:5914697-Ditylum_brightwellii.AAC.1
MRRIRSEDENSDSESEDDGLNESVNDLEATIENELTRSDIETVIEAVDETLTNAKLHVHN